MDFRGKSKSKLAQFYETQEASAERDPDNEMDFGDEINIPQTDLDYDTLEKSKKGEERGASLRRANDTGSISTSHGKYAGKRGTRNEVVESTLDSEEDGAEDDDSDIGQGDSQWNMEGSESEEGEESEESEESEQSEDEDDNGAALFAASKNVTKATNKPQELDEAGIASEDSDLQKSKHTKNQMQVWDDIMSIRMLLQPALTQATRLPQTTDFEHFAKSDNSLRAELKETSSDVAKIMDDLISIQTQYLEQSKALQPQSAKKRPRADATSEQWWNTIEDLNSQMNTYCGTVLDKWSGKMQVSSGKIFTKKFQSLNQGFMHQIESLFNDRDRMVKRTTHIKKEVQIFGKEEQKEFDDEIFDDTDFYQSLLKDLITKGTTGYGEMQDGKRVKTKDKKSYLGHASKGRMVNYDVQDKLVHFMAPDDRPIPCDWNLDELFVNLFGQSTKSGS